VRTSCQTMCFVDTRLCGVNKTRGVSDATNIVIENLRIRCQTEHTTVLLVHIAPCIQGVSCIGNAVSNKGQYSSSVPYSNPSTVLTNHRMQRPIAIGPLPISPDSSIPLPGPPYKHHEPRTGTLGSLKVDFCEGCYGRKWCIGPYSGHSRSLGTPPHSGPTRWNYVLAKEIRSTPVPVGRTKAYELCDN